MINLKPALTMTMIAFITLLTALAVTAASATRSNPADPEGRSAALRLFYSNDVRGELEPCG